MNLYEFMIWFLYEDDRSRDWTDEYLQENIHKVRPELRPYIFEYRKGGLDRVLKILHPDLRKKFDLKE